MYPNQTYDSFQQQLNDLQKSYSSLGKSMPQAFAPTAKHEILRVSGIDAAKAWAKDNLAPGESKDLFDENEDLFYVVSKNPEGIVQPLILGRFTLEVEPPKPEYATKQDFAKLEAMLQKLLDKEKSE